MLAERRSHAGRFCSWTIADRESRLTLMLASGQSPDSRDHLAPGGPPRFFALSVTATGTFLAGTCGRGTSRSTDGGRTWTPVAGPGNGFVNDFAVEPGGAVLASTGGSGLYRSLDDGSTWEALGLDGMVLYGLATGPELLVGTDGSGVMGSADGGRSWAAAAGLDDGVVFRVLARVDGSVLAATEDRGVWRREQGRWRPVGLNGRSVFALLDMGEDGVLAGTRGDGIYRSLDGGTSWEPVGAGPPDPIVHTLVSTSAGAVLAGTGRGVHRSIDGGATWTPMGGELAVRRIFSVAAGSTTVLAGSYDGVWQSSPDDDGWRAMDTGLSPGEAFTVAVGPGGLALVGTRTGALVSSDAGASWREVAGGLEDAVCHAFCWTAAGEVLAGTEDGVWSTTDPVMGAWERTGLSGRWVFSLLEVEPGRVLAGTLGEGVFARDATGEWSESGAGLTDPLVYDLMLTRDGEVVAATGAVIDGAKSGGVFRSSDGGRSWTPTDHERITTYRLVQGTTGRMYGGAQRCHILRSDDGGASWKLLPPRDLDDLKMFCLALDSGDRLYMAAGAVLMCSDDGADSWDPIGEGLDGVTVYDLAEHPDGALLAATSAGIYRSRDRGATWQALGPGA